MSEEDEEILRRIKDLLDNYIPAPEIGADGKEE